MSKASLKRETVEAAVKLTLRASKYFSKENAPEVVMTSAFMIGMALARLSPGPRREVRKSVDGIIDDVIKEYSK